MRILQLVQRYWPAKGGAENYIGEISRRLAGDGHQVTVATTDALDFALLWDHRWSRVPESEAEHHGVRVLRFPVRHLPASPLSHMALRRLLWLLSVSRLAPIGLLKRVARFTPWVPGLWRWLESTEESFDLVTGMTICYESLIEPGLRFARRRGIPFAVCPLTHLGAGDRLGRDYLSSFYTMRHQVEMVRSSDAVVALTPAEKAFYENVGIEAERIVVAGAGVNPEEVLGGDRKRGLTRFGLRGPVVLFLSSLTYDKGAFHVVDAVRRLWSRGRQVDLVMAGAPQPRFRRFLTKLPAGDRERIHVLGHVSEAEKRDLLAAADIFAMPSRTDSFGIVYLEAWLYGKPVIGASAWAIRDVVHDGGDGLLVPFADVEALAHAMARLLDDPARRREMGRRGERRVYETSTWDSRYPLVRDLYLRLARSSGA
jgi:glycosyltransferase involved in cell wall biosynthesis